MNNKYLLVLFFLTLFIFCENQTKLELIDENFVGQYIDKFNNEFYNISLPTIEPSISQPNITNGGLLDDWNYDIFF